MCRLTDSAFRDCKLVFSSVNYWGFRDNDMTGGKGYTGSWYVIQKLALRCFSSKKSGPGWRCLAREGHPEMALLRASYNGPVRPGVVFYYHVGAHAICW